VRYQINSFPITEGYSTEFVASFIFLGDKAPKVKVQSDFSDGQVIDIYEYDQERRDRKTLIIALGILIPIAIVFLIFIVWQTNSDRKRLIKRIESEALKEYESFAKENKNFNKGSAVELSVNSYLSAIGKANNSSQEGVQKTHTST